MSENQEKKINIAPDFIIEDLLNQNRELAKQKAMQVAISQQLQAESRQFLELAQKYEVENAGLKEELEKFKETVEKLEKHFAKTAGPVPVEAEIIEPK